MVPVVVERIVSQPGAERLLGLDGGTRASVAQRRGAGIRRTQALLEIELVTWCVLERRHRGVGRRLTVQPQQAAFLRVRRDACRGPRGKLVGGGLDALLDGGIGLALPPGNRAFLQEAAGNGASSGDTRTNCGGGERNGTYSLFQDEVMFFGNYRLAHLIEVISVVDAHQADMIGQRQKRM